MRGSIRKRPEFVLVAVTLLVFLPSVLLGFVFDDLLLIVQDSHIHNASAFYRVFSRTLWQTEGFENANVLAYYRPLVSATYTLNWLLSGGKAWFFHLTNVALHVGAVWAGYRVALGWLRDRRLAFLVAVVFAIHPSRWEDVLWVSGRTDVMLALFGFLAVLALRRVFSEGRWVWMVAAAFAGVAACLSKEGGAILPLMFLVEYLSIPAAERTPKQRWSALGLSVLPVAYLVWRIVWLPIVDAGGRWVPRYFLLTVWSYVERIFVPWPQTFFYRPLVVVNTVPQVPMWILVAGALVVILYTALVVQAFRKDRVAAWLLLAAVAFLGPLLNFRTTGIPSTASDRFLYIPLFLLTCALARLYGEAILRWAERSGVRLAAMAVAVVWVGLIWTQFGPMRSERALWTHEYELRPDSPIALRQKARMLALDGKPSEAYAAYAESLSERSRSYTLISFPAAKASSIVEMTAIQAGQLPDGAHQKLEGIYSGLAELEAGYPPGGGRLKIDRDTYAFLIGRSGPMMRGELALLASRLGKFSAVSKLLDKIPPNAQERVSNAMNLALAAARAHDWKQAERWLGVEQRMIDAQRSKATPAALDELRTRIARAKAAHHRGQSLTGSAKAVVLAQADADLGAYGVAARRLQDVYNANPETPGVAQLYAQVLVASRRDTAAKQVVSAALGKDKAAGIVANLRAQLAEPLRDLPSVD